MRQTTLNFALPDSMRAWVDQRVASGQYGNTSEYLRDLIRKDQVEQAKARLRSLIEEGVASGPARPWGQADTDELLAIARGELD